jgi:hypothetical protein
MSTPETLEIDPTSVVAPVEAVAVVAPAPLPELRYEYQPSDENGRPMGGKQVIIYRTNDELRDKLVKQNESILRQLRKVSREKELGTNDVADDAEKFQNVAEFKSRTLTADERFDLSQKIANPETASEARDLFIESAFGVKPEVLARTLNDTQKFIIQQRAVENYIEFANSSADYYDSAENRETVTRWMAKKNYAPTVTNFKAAFDKLTASGLLEVNPVMQQASVAAAPVVEQPVTVEPEPAAQVPAVAPLGLEASVQPQKRHSHVPSGLNASVASTAGISPVDGPSVTLSDIDKLPSEVYRTKLKDPAFAALVNKLEQEAAQKRAERGIRR